MLPHPFISATASTLPKLQCSATQLGAIASIVTSHLSLRWWALRYPSLREGVKFDDDFGFGTCDFHFPIRKWYPSSACPSPPQSS